MGRDVGGYDRPVRLVVGAALLVATAAEYAGTIPLAVGPLPRALAAVSLLVVGAVLLVTGYARQGPAWRLVGVDTLRRG